MIIGLTGGIGAGKSTVCARLAELGARVIAADEISRNMLAPGSAAVAQVQLRFGSEVFAEPGVIDRAALAAVVFADPVARRDLEDIVLPVVDARIASELAAVDSREVVVVESPLLFERHEQGRYERIVVVHADEAVRRERLLARGMAAADIAARMAAQVTDAQRVGGADYVLNNDGTNLDQEVRRLWDWIAGGAK